MTQDLFQIRGVIEGFYGVYYTFPERNDLIRFIGRHGFNFYIYAPKNDRQHRNRWWEPYPDRVMGQFAQTIAAAQESGVRFCYAISPGISISYSSQEDFARLTGKLAAFFALGVRDFSILLDDIDPGLSSGSDRWVYRSYAHAQADLSNRLFAWLKQQDPGCTLNMCPTNYHGSAPFHPSLIELGELLHPEIDIFYTGPEVCSPAISSADAEAFGQAVRRQPIIWDNYPVNDLAMQGEMHIGPIQGRDAGLYRSVRGVVANTMQQAEASKIALRTFAAYFKNPAGYDPHQSWLNALLDLVGEDGMDAILKFSENSLHSCLVAEDSDALKCMVAETLEALRAGGAPSSISAFHELDSYLKSLDEACYYLKFRTENLALRNNLLPWIELLEHWQGMGRRCIQVLLDLEKGQPFEKSLHAMKETLDAAQNHSKRIAGSALLPLAEYVLERTWSVMVPKQKAAAVGNGPVQYSPQASGLSEAQPAYRQG